MILCIETATQICSVALCDNGKVIGLRESRVDKSHASLLTIFIGELLGEAKIKATDLDAVAVSKGPGSYTGLRIGVSTAKGICYGAGIPLIAIDTMKGMYYGAAAIYKDTITEKSLLCPMIDARRMEVYSSLFNSSGEKIKDVTAEIIDSDSYKSELEESTVIFFGNGADKCADTIINKKALFIKDFELSAAHLITPATEAFEKKQFVDTAYFEPYYLKDFIATIPRKNLLGR